VQKQQPQEQTARCYETEYPSVDRRIIGARIHAAAGQVQAVHRNVPALTSWWHIMYTSQLSSPLIYVAKRAEKAITHPKRPHTAFVLLASQTRLWPEYRTMNHHRSNTLGRVPTTHERDAESVARCYVPDQCRGLTLRFALWNSDSSCQLRGAAHADMLARRCDPWCV